MCSARADDDNVKPFYGKAVATAPASRVNGIQVLDCAARPVATSMPCGPVMLGVAAGGLVGNTGEQAAKCYGVTLRLTEGTRGLSVDQVTKSALERGNLIAS